MTACMGRTVPRGPCGSSASGSLRLEIRLRPRRDRTPHASGHFVRVRVYLERRARGPPPRAGGHLVRPAPRRVADYRGGHRGYGHRRAGRPPAIRAADPPRDAGPTDGERVLSGRELCERAVSPLPVRRDRAVRAHSPALLPGQGPRLHHGLPARAVYRRRRGPLRAALCAARVARRRRAAADLAARRPVRAVADPRVAYALMAPAQRELTGLLPDARRRPLRRGAPRPPSAGDSHTPPPPGP